ncbi:hypothetical protein LJC18_05930, partial [Lachnospiraceae bacterium OttesenSCG-928-E19]|nr:hypothetical protein [Lachnospiraceae bacterium OttesenSCG-928-E19]
MDYGDKLNGPSLQAQSNAAISKLQEDIQVLNALKEAVTSFNDGGELKGTSIKGIKQQLGDYISVIEAEINAYEFDIEDFQTLSSVVGNEVIDGAAILDEWDYAKAGMVSAESSAENARFWASFFRFLQNNDVALILENDARIYEEQANTWAQIIDWCQEKANKFDQIKNSTEGLFDTGQSIRDTTTTALSDIMGAFKVNGYAPNSGAKWRSVLSIYTENVEVTRKLLALGCTAEEIETLRCMGVIITLDDLKNLELTVNTEKIFVSEDCTSLFYKGKVYIISIPNKGPTIEPIWNEDGRIKLTSIDFDLVAGLTGINLEDIPKDEIRTADNSHILQNSSLNSNDANVKNAATISALMGFGSFMKNSLNHSEVYINFQSSGSNKKATIMVGDFQSRQKFANINYNVPVNTYGQQTDWISEELASRQAKGIYNAVKGNEVPDQKATYTLTGTLDERHKNQVSSGYLFYSEEGALMYSPQIYSGDKAYIATCGKHTGIINENICDLTEYLSIPSYADSEVQEILE